VLELKEELAMAKGRGSRPPSRLDKRREVEALEARERDEDELEEEEEEAESEADEGDEDEDYGSEKKKSGKKATKKAGVTKTTKTTSKRRTTKEVRRRAVWVVYDNTQKPVEEFPYNQKADAEALLARKLQEKEGKATYYLNLVKVEMKE
jgi:hypothetical protein